MEITIENLKAILKKSHAGGNVDELSNDVSLTLQGVDSLDLLDFYLSLEENFDIKIPDEDIKDLKSLNDFQAYISKKVK